MCYFISICSATLHDTTILGIYVRDELRNAGKTNEFRGVVNTSLPPNPSRVYGTFVKLLATKKKLYNMCGILVWLQIIHIGCDPSFTILPSCHSYISPLSGTQSYSTPLVFIPSQQKQQQPHIVTYTNELNNNM